MSPLHAIDLDPDPFEQFQKWFVDAESAGVDQPDAMALATSTPDGQPTVRMVLLKRVDDRGFVFFTNYHSRKGRQLSENPRASLLFHWKELHRQVTLVGIVSRIPAVESDTYFASRPRDSQLAAWASRQSEVVADRETLDAQFALMAERYLDDVPRPAHWGGFRLVPETFEFWQRGDHRLHDRLRYRRAEGGWRVERVSP